MSIRPEYPPVRAPRKVAPETPWTARIATARPNQAILFERPLPGGGHAVLTALVDRRTGELVLVGEALGLVRSEVDELRMHARGDGDLEPIPLELARLRMARAVLASRVAGRPVPAWLMARADLVGDPCHPSSRIDDLYLCTTCDAPLPPAEQLAFAYREGARRDLRCPGCRGEDGPRASDAAAWQDRAWLMLAADLPHRTLVCAARAEAARLPHDRLDIVRGLAYLRLEQGAQALHHLERAAASGEPDRRLSVWVSRAQDLCDRLAPVRLAKDRDRTLPNPVPGHGSTRAFGPVPAFA